MDTKLRHYVTHILVYRSYSLLLMVIGVIGCLLGVWTSGRWGIARLLSTYGSSAQVMAAADEAVRISPADPEVHFARAAMLLGLGQLKAAREALEQATTLRPRDYRLWQEFGRVRDLGDDSRGALAAFRQAVDLAPYYARARWQLGNLLLREGRIDEAFTELRKAAAGDPELLPNLADLAWGAFEGEPHAVEQALEPQTVAARIELASLFIKHGKIDEARPLLRALRDLSDRERNRLVSELLDANYFDDAYRVWAGGRKREDEIRRAGSAVVSDGGFEQPINPDERGFGWRSTPSTPMLHISQDQTERHSGHSSLRFDWNGNIDAVTPLVWQFVLVEPRQHYTLSFAARSEDLVTGALPEVTVADAENGGRMLLQAVSLPGGTNNWRNYSAGFVAGEATCAVRIVIRRQSCAMLPCPVFGKTWFDDFTLAPVAAPNAIPTSSMHVAVSKAIIRWGNRTRPRQLPLLIEIIEFLL